LAQRGVLGQPVAVIVHDFPVVQPGEPRAEAVVKFVQHQWIHARQNNVIDFARRKMESHCVGARFTAN
jgi:hypothetical protein